MTTQRDMLITCRDQFAMYGQNHRAKVGRWQRDIEALDASIPEQAKEIESLRASIADTIHKAEVNEQLALDIQAVLNEPVSDTLMATAMFPAIVYDDGVTDKNQQTQLGVHFEEVAEMLGTLDGRDITTAELLGQAQQSLNHLATHLKNGEPMLVRINDRVEFLDSICDQLVTATVGAVLFGMDPVGGLREVNRSNYSKLINGRMEKAPVTAKWIKGPNYTPPELEKFTHTSLI